jgi:hypothetical protein
LMVTFDSASHKAPVPALARRLLGLGIGRHVVPGRSGRLALFGLLPVVLTERGHRVAVNNEVWFVKGWRG